MTAQITPSIPYTAGPDSAPKTFRQQETSFTGFYTVDGIRYRQVVTLHFDDRCRNGHNTFSITSEIHRKARNNRWVDDAAGYCHDSVIKHFPRLAHMVKWHLCSTDGPMHYQSNALYYMRQYLDTGPKHPTMLAQAAVDKDCWKRTVVYGACPDDRRPVTASGTELGESILQYGTTTSMANFLDERRPALIAAFRRDLEALGFMWECPQEGPSA